MILKLISWNVNGLRACVKNDALGWITQEKPDFLALQEIKVSEDKIPSEIYNLGFENLDVNSGEKAGYSGVASLHNLKCVTFKNLFFKKTKGAFCSTILMKFHYLIYIFQTVKKMKTDLISRWNFMINF